MTLHKNDYIYLLRQFIYLIYNNLDLQKKQKHSNANKASAGRNLILV